MALQKSEEQPSGFSADYWKITRVTVTPDYCQCEVALYKDNAARIADKSPVKTTSYEWSGADHPCEVADMDVVDKNVYSLCYDKLKTLPEFSGALDV